MHFHYASFLLGLVFGIVLVCLMIFLVLKWSIKTDEELFRKQKSLDDFSEEDVNSHE